MAKRPRPGMSTPSGRDPSGRRSPAVNGPAVNDPGRNGTPLGTAALNSGGSRGRSGSASTSSSPRPSDAAARARARRRAAESPRRSWRDRPGMLLAIGVVVVAVALGGLAFLAWRQSGSPGPSSNVAGVTDWQADPPGLQDRLQAAGLPALNTEGEALHIHQHLDLYVDGAHIPVPADIGVDQAAGIISPLHTHDDTGVIHVESPTVQEFTLAQFFKVWGVDLSPVAIGGYKIDATHQLKMWVNGQLYTSDPGSLALQAHQEIVIAYGTAAQMPSPVPASYGWTSGL